MLLQISAVIVAVSFVILTFYLIQTLKSLKGSLDEMTLAMGQMKNEAKEISEEVKEMIGNTNDIAVDMRMKLSKLDHAFGSVNDVGQAVHELTSAARQTASSLLASLKRNGSRACEPERSGRWQAVWEGVITAVEFVQRRRTAQSPAHRAGSE